MIAMAVTMCIAIGAQPRFTVQERSLRIGEIMFQSPKTVVFSFVNDGNKPLMIKEVHPSCGCIKVDYPQRAVAAGQSGIISATYDAAMLGSFYRELAVYTNGQEEPCYLSFQGRVVETAMDYEGDFPIDLGNVRLNANYVEFDDVNKGDKPVVEIQVANVEHTAYTPQLMHLPNYLSAEYLPAIIQPGRTGKIRLTLKSDKLFLDGLNQTSVYLARYMGDKVSEQNEIVVSAVLLPAFRNLTPDKLSSAPRVVLMDGEDLVKDEVQVVMGEKKKVTKVLSVTNIGEEQLTFSNVQVFNRAMTVSLGDRNVAPHASTKLKITVDARELEKAKSGPRLLLISNDPRQPKIILNLNIE